MGPRSFICCHSQSHPVVRFAIDLYINSNLLKQLDACFHFYSNVTNTGAAAAAAFTDKNDEDNNNDEDDDDDELKTYVEESGGCRNVPAGLVKSLAVYIG